MSVGAFIACCAFSLIGTLCERFKESNVLIWGGFFLMVIGRLVVMPYRNEYPKLAHERKFMDQNGTIGYYDDDDPMVLGCPVASQPWCETTPVLGENRIRLHYCMCKHRFLIFQDFLNLSLAMFYRVYHIQLE